MRPDPTGKRALFTSRADDDHTADGKEALFSQRDRAPGKFTIECGRCGATSHVDATDAMRRILSFSLWIPGKSYSRNLRCPACHRRAWVRVRVV